jgi:hypothetical protein
MVVMRGTLVHDRAAYNAGLRQDGSMTRFHSTRVKRSHSHSLTSMHPTRTCTNFVLAKGGALAAGGRDGA